MSATTIYQCTRCGHQGAWGEGWHWWGSWITGAKRILCPACSRSEVDVVIRP